MRVTDPRMRGHIQMKIKRRKKRKKKTYCYSVSCQRTFLYEQKKYSTIKTFSYTFTAHFQPLTQQDTSEITVPCSKMHILYTYGVPGGKVSILGGHSIVHSKQKSVYVHMSHSEWFPR
jgi:hypothetical protein